MHRDCKMLLYFYVQALCGWTAEIPALGNVCGAHWESEEEKKELI